MRHVIGVLLVIATLTSHAESTPKKTSDWEVTTSRLFDGATYTACTSPGPSQALCVKCEISDGEKILGIMAYTQDTIGYVLNEHAQLEVRVDNQPIVVQGGTVVASDMAIARVLTIDSTHEAHSGNFYAKDIIGQMRRGNTIALRITTQTRSDIVASLRGFTVATRELLQACK